MANQSSFRRIEFGSYQLSKGGSSEIYTKGVELHVTADAIRIHPITLHASKASKSCYISIPNNYEDIQSLIKLLEES